MKRLLILLALLLATPAFAQTTIRLCYINANGGCTPVGTSAPFPVTGTFTPSGTQDVNLTKVGGTAFALGQGLMAASVPVAIASNQSALTVTGAGGTFPATQSTSPWIVAGGGTAGTAATGVVTVQGIASMTPVQITLPTTPLIASGNGVVITPTTEAASAIAPSTAVATAEACRVLAAAAANLYKLTVAIAATTGYVMIFNATSAPVDGAVSPVWPAIRVVSDGTSGWVDIPFDPPLRLGTGATVCFSSTGPFTKTASATAAIGGLVK